MEPPFIITTKVIFVYGCKRTDVTYAQLFSFAEKIGNLTLGLTAMVKISPKLAYDYSAS